MLVTPRDKWETVNATEQKYVPASDDQFEGFTWVLNFSLAILVFMGRQQTQKEMTGMPDS